MPVPVTSTQFPDVLDSRFAEIFDNRYKQIADMVGTFYSIKQGASAPQRQDYRTSSVGAFGDVSEFTGTVPYDDVSEGYDGTITPKQYASGFQIERTLFDDDLTGIMEAKPAQLALAWARTRQKHAASTFNNAASVDTTWNSFTENVALISDSHTTRSGASTASGFDNLTTAALSTVSLAAANIQFQGFRDDRANRMSVAPSMILYPPNLYQTAFEIVESAGVPENANNARNVHEGKYRLVQWNYLTDTNNWFLIDESMMKDALTWVERVTSEFAMVEDFETLVGKWRLYGRYGLGHRDWRWILGGIVS